MHTPPYRAFLAVFTAIILFSVSALSQAQNQNSRFLPPIHFLLLTEDEQVNELVFDTPIENTIVTIPEGVNFIRAVVDGAGGGSSASAEGGRGGRTTATIPVTPGDRLEVSVGGRGTDNTIGGGGGGATTSTTFSTC